MSALPSAGTSEPGKGKGKRKPPPHPLHAGEKDSDGGPGEGKGKALTYKERKKQETSQLSAGNRTAASSSTRAIKVLCVGDSNTAGFINHYTEEEPWAHIMATEINRHLASDEHFLVEAHPLGFTGFTSEQILSVVRKQGSEFLAAYDIVVIMAGTNDLGSGVSADTLLENLVSLHRLSHAAGCATVACTIFESGSLDGREKRSAHHEANSAIVATFQNFEKVRVVDTCRLMPYVHGSDLWSIDKLHLSSIGFKVYALTLAPSIASYVQELQLVHSKPSTSTGSLAKSSNVVRLRVLCLGASLVAGWRGSERADEPWAEAMADEICRQLGQKNIYVEAVAFGMPGKTSGEILEFVNGQAGGFLPGYDLVVIMAGTNDLGCGTPPDKLVHNLSCLHKLCHDAGSSTIACTLFEMGGLADSHERQAAHAEANMSILSGFQGSEKVYVVDTCKLMPFVHGSDLWDIDCLHLSSFGYKCFALRLAPFVAQCIIDNGFGSA